VAVIGRVSGQNPLKKRSYTTLVLVLWLFGGLWGRSPRLGWLAGAAALAGWPNAYGGPLCGP